MRVADRHGRSLSEVLDYPAWELPYWAAWISHEPTDGQRIEFAVARFMCQWTAAHMKKGKAPPKPKDFVIRDYWTEQAELDKARAAKRDVDAMIAELKDAGIRVINATPEPDYL